MIGAPDEVRPCMRFVILLAALFSSLVGIRSAHASCAIEPAYVGTDTVPVGCALVVYMSDATATPKVIAMRGSTRIDVTGTMTSEPVSVPLFVEESSCTGEGTQSQYPFERFTIELSGVAQGDTLELEGVQTALLEPVRATVVAAGACPGAIAPMLACADDTPEDCEALGVGDGGCSSAPSPTGVATFALAIGLIGFGLLRRRR